MEKGMLRTATPVNTLYGVEGLSADAKPTIGTLTKSWLGYFLRDGKHSMIRPDCEGFLGG